MVWVWPTVSRLTMKKGRIWDLLKQYDTNPRSKVHRFIKPLKDHEDCFPTRVKLRSVLSEILANEGFVRRAHEDYDWIKVQPLMCKSAP